MSFKKILGIFAVIGLIVLLLIYPENSLQGARYGLDLWLKNVLPSLLPFVVASFILLETGIVSLIARFFSPVMRLLFAAPGESAYVLFASVLSGYPVGAKLTGELFKQGKISESEAQRTLRFTSVCGPVFITGAVSTGMLGIPEAGVYLAVTHYLSAILVGIIFGLFCRRNKVAKQRISTRNILSEFKKDVILCKPFGEILTTSVQKTVSTMLKVGGFIMLFCVIIELADAMGAIDFFTLIFSPITRLLGLTETSTSAIIRGSIEMTNGCAFGAFLNIDLTQKLSVIAFIIAFGGLCIHMQTKAMCGNVRPKLFFLAKSLQGLLAYALCTLALAAFPITIAASGIQTDAKTAAYFGIAFAAVSFLILVVIKCVQKNAKSFSALSRKL